MVNGQEMTGGFIQTQKIMAHFPLTTFKFKPDSTLIIACGMETTFRSMLSWDINTTVVDLVPSVPVAFGDFYNGADQIKANPKGQIIINDGRHFLTRTKKSFDLISGASPPPTNSASSGMLYSEEFYNVAKKRLREKGLLIQ